MNDVWIAPIFAILGTVLGVSIPSFAKYLENKSSHSKEKKEKHEVIIRKILTEFIPTLNYSLYLASNYLKNKKVGLLIADSPDITSDKIKNVQDLYLSEIKPHYPLEMHSKMSELNSEITWLYMDIGFDNIDDFSSDTKITQNINKCKLLISDIVKHIEKTYI